VCARVRVRVRVRACACACVRVCVYAYTHVRVCVCACVRARAPEYPLRVRTPARASTQAPPPCWQGAPGSRTRTPTAACTGGGATPLLLLLLLLLPTQRAGSVLMCGNRAAAILAWPCCACAAVKGTLDCDCALAACVRQAHYINCWCSQQPAGRQASQQARRQEQQPVSRLHQHPPSPAHQAGASVHAWYEPACAAR